MKKAQLVSMGCGSLVGLLFLAQVGLAQTPCVPVAPPEVKARIIAAIQVLPPEQAQEIVTEFKGLTADAQQVFLERLRRILQLLPSDLHQPFIDGVFEVSPREADFAAEVLARVKASVARGAQLPATCSPGPGMRLPTGVAR